MKKPTHKEFVKLSKEKKIKVGVSKTYAERIAITHPKADRNNARAVRFWMYLEALLIFVAPIPLWIFKGFIFAIGSVLIGITIRKANIQSATDFIIRDMTKDKEFYDSIMSGNEDLDDVRRPVIITIN